VKIENLTKPKAKSKSYSDEVRQGQKPRMWCLVHPGGI